MRTERPKPSPIRDRFRLTSGVLDANRMLSYAATARVGDVCSVKLAEKHLSKVASDTLTSFRNLVHIDCSGNLFEDIDGFSTIPKLEVLEVPLNRISTISIPDTGFANLTVLDLSFNRLTADSISPLGRLPALESLDLTGNEMRSIGMLAGPGLFPWLRDLILDKNRLSGPEPFGATCGLPELSFLSLADNNLRFIPLIELEKHNEKNSDSGNIKHPSSVAPPTLFPKLKILNLSNNKITEPADLLNAADLKQLESLHIWNNPISTKRKALPLVLQVELCERRKIEVLCHEYKEPKVKRMVRLDPSAMVTVVPLTMPPVKLGGGLAALEPQRQPPPRYLEFDSILEPSINSLPPIKSQDLESDDQKPTGSAFLTQLDSVDVDMMSTTLSTSGEHDASRTMDNINSDDSFENQTSVSQDQERLDASAALAVTNSQLERLHTSTVDVLREYRVHEPVNPYLPSTTTNNPPISSQRGKKKSNHFSKEHALAELQKLGFKSRTSQTATKEQVLRAPQGAFEELFREDDLFERETNVDLALPKSILGSIRALKHALEHPLQLHPVPLRDSELSIQEGESTWQKSKIEELLLHKE